MSDSQVDPSDCFDEALRNANRYDHWEVVNLLICDELVDQYVISLKMMITLRLCLLVTDVNPFLSKTLQHFSLIALYYFRQDVSYYTRAPLI